MSALGAVWMVPGLAFIYGAASQDPNPPTKSGFSSLQLDFGPPRDAKFILGGTLTAVGAATLVAGVACIVYGAWEVPVDRARARIWLIPGGVVGQF